MGVVRAGDTEKLPEGTAMAANFSGMRLVEAGSTTLDHVESPRASRDGAATPPAQVSHCFFFCMIQLWKLYS